MSLDFPPPPLPSPKLPHFGTPSIRDIPQIPNVGCVSGNPITYVGGQLGNMPDHKALPQIKALKKVIEEQIGTLLEGKSPDFVRPALYEIRRARLVTELADIVS